MKSIDEIITEHIKERYRKKKNSTKALKDSYVALKNLLVDIVKEDNKDISDIELEEVKKYFDEFFSKEEFMI